MTFPSRLEGLIKQLESGQPLTRDLVRRTEQLQILDLAKVGEDFAREAIERDRQGMDDFALREKEKLNVIK